MPFIKRISNKPPHKPVKKVEYCYCQECEQYYIEKTRDQINEIDNTK